DRRPAAAFRQRDQHTARVGAFDDLRQFGEGAANTVAVAGSWRRGRLHYAHELVITAWAIAQLPRDLLGERRAADDQNPFAAAAERWECPGVGSHCDLQ